MNNRITSVHIRNFRSLADVSIDLGPVNILFGPNGSGKSTFLDALWFVRDCAIRGVELASSNRSHGIGILFDGASEDDQSVSIELTTDDVRYLVQFSLSSGRIDSSPGERLVNLRDGKELISREVGRDYAMLYNSTVDQSAGYTLREPEKLTLNLYMGFNPADAYAGSLDQILHYVRMYHCRSLMLHRLKTHGSESGPETRLWDRGDNAWSVLRNLHDRKHVDERFDTIMQFMREAFPSFDGIVLEQTGPNSVYASFLEKHRSRPILASGVSDGHLHLLMLLTALFSEGPQREALILLDEPEISLHPWAISVLAKAIRVAGISWNKQVLVATHSPVLISQFEPREVVAAEVEDGRTRLQPISEIEGISDLLDEYAAGSLYMAQMIGAQSPPEPVGEKVDE